VKELRLTGYADRPQEFLAGLHLYLQPSRSEGFCIAAHEAMVAALPVLGSAVGEMPHSIQDGITGHVVPPDNPEALADRLHQLLCDPAALHRMGNAARSVVMERFSEAQFIAAGTAAISRLDAAHA
jgi:glycosyltransferase involved in cell wall biosynthesis